MLRAKKLTSLFARVNKSFVSIPVRGVTTRVVQEPSVEPERFDTPAAPQYQPSIIENLFYRSKYPRVPLDTAWPNLPPLLSKDEPVAAALPKITTLPNGLRVATMPSTSASPVAAVGVFVDAGSRYETQDINNGLTHLLEQMSLKSTSNRTDYRLVRDMGSLGVNIVCTSTREHLMFQSEALPEHLPAVVGAIADCMQNNIFHDQELNETLDSYDANIAHRAENQEAVLLDVVHEAAYGPNTVGLPILGQPELVHEMTREHLQGYVDTFFQPGRMVICGVGVEHDDLIKMINSSFKKINNLSNTETNKAPALYKGGEIRLPESQDGMTHVAMAFEQPDWHSKDVYASCILQTIMGGGGSFSAGGPGKGMYSRLYTNVLNQHAWAESVISFQSIFVDSGLFGLYGKCPPENAKNLVEVLSRELNDMAGKPVGDEELTRAKNSLKTSIHMQLESRPARLDDLGRQLLIYGKYEDASTVCAAIDAVNAADIKRVASKILSSPLTLVVTGDHSQQIPRYEIVQSTINKA